jgi:hypothetical protein
VTADDATVGNNPDVSQAFTLMTRPPSLIQRRLESGLHQTPTMGEHDPVSGPRCGGNFAVVRVSAGLMPLIRS